MYCLNSLQINEFYQQDSPNSKKDTYDENIDCEVQDY